MGDKSIYGLVHIRLQKQKTKNDSEYFNAWQKRSVERTESASSEDPQLSKLADSTENRMMVTMDEN
jgi:hypothetical protein